MRARGRSVAAWLLALSASASAPAWAAPLFPSKLPTGSYAPKVPLLPGTPPFLDTDMDGVPDHLDPCPQFTGPAAPASYSPTCWLNLPWVDPKFAAPGKETPPGPGWVGCDPLVAYRVTDTLVENSTGVAVVGVATSMPSSDRLLVLDAASQGKQFPGQLGAQCVLFLDLETGKQTMLSDASIANWWAHWDGGSSAAAKPAGQMSPSWSFGLLREEGVLQTRGTIGAQGNSHFWRFTRAAVHVPDETAPVVVTLAPAGGATLTVPLWDPSKKAPLTAGSLGAWSNKVATATTLSPGVYPPPSTWSVVPLAVHAALMKDADQFGVETGLGNRAGAVPSMRLDDRVQLVPAAIEPVYKGAGGLSRGLPFKGIVLWELFPPELAVHDNLYRYSTWQAPQTVIPVRYAASAGTALASATIKTGPGKYRRTGTVEAQTGTDVRASVSRPVSVAQYSEWGGRWSTNVGVSKNCFASVSAPDEYAADQVYWKGVASGQTAQQWCPSELDAFRAEQPEFSYLGAGNTTCKEFRDNHADVYAILGKALASALASECAWEAPFAAAAKAVAALGEAAACCGCQAGTSLCVGPLSSVCPSCNCSCASAAKDIYRKALDPILECLIDVAVATVAASTPNEPHWPSLATASHPLVPFVGQVNFAEGTRSRMTYGDSLLAGSHQGNDWNWAFPPDTADPWYRGFGLRKNKDGKRTYVEIENELEYQVATGDWKRVPPDIPLLHGFTQRKFLFDALAKLGKGNGAIALFYQAVIGIVGDEANSPKDPLYVTDVEWLGELWPADQCDVHGISRSSLTESAKGNTLTYPKGGNSFAADGSMQEDVGEPLRARHLLAPHT